MPLAELPPLAQLEIFEPLAKLACLFGVECVERTEEAVAVVSRDICFGKSLAHAVLQPAAAKIADGICHCEERRDDAISIRR